MNTKESLLNDLHKSGIKPNGTLLVHSSAKRVGECENRGDTILDAFMEYMKDGLLILPAHTWDTVIWKMFDDDGVPVGTKKEDSVFDHQNAPSCVGVLTNLFLKRKGVVRSMHPTHSLAAIGKDAADFIKGEEFTQTPCPRNGCYGKLYDRGAQILFLGCDLTKNTYLHGVEEWNDIPNRLTKKPQRLYIKKDDELIPCPQFRHYYPGGNISENYHKAESLLIEKGAAAYCKIGHAHCVLTDAVKTADLISGVLKNEPDYFANLK